MVLLQFTRSDEEVFFQWKGRPEPRRLAGSLAVEILGAARLSSRQAQAAGRRLERWIQQAERWPKGRIAKRWSDDVQDFIEAPQGPLLPERRRPVSGPSLQLIANQLHSWTARRQLRWDASFGLGDGPTPELSEELGASLLRAIEWRGPAHGEYSETLRAASPEAAVLISALYGTIRQTLTVCFNCKNLFTVAKANRQRRQCPACGARRWAVPEKFRRIYRRAYERVCKRWPGKHPERAAATARLIDIRQRCENRRTSPDTAIAEIQAAFPRSSRGRQPEK